MNIIKKRYNSTLTFIFLAMISISCNEISIYDESVVIKSQTESNEIIFNYKNKNYLTIYSIFVLYI